MPEMPAPGAGPSQDHNDAVHTALQKGSLVAGSLRFPKGSTPLGSVTPKRGVCLVRPVPAPAPEIHNAHRLAFYGATPRTRRHRRCHIMPASGMHVAQWRIFYGVTPLDERRRGGVHTAGWEVSHNSHFRDPCRPLGPLRPNCVGCALEGCGRHPAAWEGVTHFAFPGFVAFRSGHLPMMWCSGAIVHGPPWLSCNKSEGKRNETTIIKEKDWPVPRCTKREPVGQVTPPPLNPPIYTCTHPYTIHRPAMARVLGPPKMFPKESRPMGHKTRANPPPSHIHCTIQTSIQSTSPLLVPPIHRHMCGCETNWNSRKDTGGPQLVRCGPATVQPRLPHGLHCHLSALCASLTPQPWQQWVLRAN